MPGEIGSPGQYVESGRRRLTAGERFEGAMQASGGYGSPSYRSPGSVGERLREKRVMFSMSPDRAHLSGDESEEDERILYSPDAIADCCIPGLAKKHNWDFGDWLWSALTGADDEGVFDYPEVVNFHCATEPNLHR